jgi:ferredoxin
MQNLAKKLPRYLLLTAVLAAVVWLALGRGERSFEAWCPFGGVESLWALLRGGQFTCALGPLNLSLMLGVLALALIAKKAFCGWLCPVGFLGELLDRAGSFWRGRPAVPPRLDGRLRLLRYLALAVILALTYWSGELLFRGFDPYYLLFSGFGHGSLPYASVIFMLALAAVSLVIPLAFCRYLCPLGAVFDPFSRLAPLRPARDAAKCTDCGLCAAACRHALPVDKCGQMKSADCTNCLDCTDACPVDGALYPLLAGRRLPGARAALLALCLLALGGGWLLRGPLTLPTSAHNFSAAAEAEVSFKVDGLKCKGSAGLLVSFYEDAPGIASIKTYASERRAVFAYDPALTSPEKIQAVMEEPQLMNDGSREVIFKAARE